MLPSTSALTFVPSRTDDPSHRIFMSGATSGAQTHNEGVRVIRCSVPIGCGMSLWAYQSEKRPEYIFLEALSDKSHRGRIWNFTWGAQIEDVEPFISLKIVSKPETKIIEVKDWLYGSRPRKEVSSYRDTSFHNARGDYDQVPYQHMSIEVKGPNGETGTFEFRFERPDFGEVSISGVPAGAEKLPVTVDFFGTPLSWEVKVSKYEDLHKVLKIFTCKEGTDALWGWWLRGLANVDLTGVKALENRKDIKPVLERLEREESLLHNFYLWLHDGKIREKTSNNKLLSALLEATGTDYDGLKAELRRVMENAPNTPPAYSYHGTPESRNICLTLMGATAKVEEGKAKTQWQYAKGAKAQAGVLGICSDRHPTLMARIAAGDISLNLFHESGSEDRLVNVEFDLLEKALTRPGWAGPLVEIFQSASRRTTYSKRVTNYIAFLFRIEKYLDRNAPRPPKSKKKVLWRAMPKFVSSQWELEMDEATEEGTTKRRSAMTPVADNEKGTITVPYVAMSVSGVRTTWCYSEVYFVAEEGAEDPIYASGGNYQSDFEEKLNGRDDYGLCFFTLTGTSRNQGYPTFLIIFERTTQHGTQVHFHRVHPSRTRGPNGTQTPPCRMVEECYRYMAGNLRADEISHQQGDLLLVSVDGPGISTEATVTVRGFENHEFVSLDPSHPVELVKATGKSRGNLLGWLHAPSGMRMPHPEHEPVEGIEPSWYELRRCKSWEANPTSVWVLNID